jgi:SAM-dependent methyltransferase
MPFRGTFDCLWCGDPWTVRAPGDLEGWAQLCGTCIGRAGSNAFLRGRLRTALAERASAGRVPAGIASTPISPSPSARGAGPSRGAGPPRAASAAFPALAAFPDEWFLRRGPFERGAVHDTAWAAELDMVTRWLDDLPPAARIAEPAAGVGFFSPLLAERGELHASDPDPAALDLARERLLAHRLLAHLHVADPWAIPAGDPFDLLVAAFLLGRVRGAGLDSAAASLRARLRTGGILALIDLHPDSAGGPPDGIRWSWHEPAVVEAALARAGFEAIRLAATGRFFLLGTALAA